MPLYRRNLLALCLTIFMGAMGWFLFAPFLPLFLSDLGIKHNQATWSGFIFAAQSLAMIVMLPFWGRVGDRRGRKLMILRAGFSIAAITFLTGICQTAWQLVLLRFVNGVMTGYVPASFALIATNTPDEFAGRYIAYAQSANAIGTIAGPVFGGLLSSLVGLRLTMMIAAGLYLISTLLVAVLVKETVKPRPEQAKTGLWEDFRQIVKLPAMPAVLLGSLILAIVAAAISPILALYLAELPGQHPTWLNGAVYALPGVAMALLAVYWTRMGERHTRVRIMGIGLIGTAAGLVGMFLTRSYVVFALCYLVSGIFQAALPPNTAARLSEQVPGDMRGRAYGIMQAASTVGYFLAPLLVSLVSAITEVRWLFAVLVLPAAIGAVWFLRRGER